MHVLIISQYFWPETFRINDLAHGLQARGHEVSVLTGLPNYPAGRLFAGYGWRSCGRSEYKGVTVYRVPLLTRRQGKSWQLALNYFSFVLFSSLLGPFLCRAKYDVVFVFEPSPFTVGLPGALFSYLKKAPLVFWVQDLWPESIVATGAIRSTFLLSLVESMVRFIYRHCDRVLIQSKGFEKPATKAGADPAKIVYFPNWAEELYRPLPRDESRPEATVLPQGFRMMFAGNLGAAQSLETLVRAAAKLRHVEDIRWVIMGDGRNRDWLERQIKEHGLENIIYLTGQRPMASMPVYFSLADVLLVTLRRDPIFELTIPSKIQSYLACGKPIIGALDGEGAKIIEESAAGFAVTAEDAEGLAEAVLKMYRLPETKRARMGESGRRYYQQHFDREHLFAKLERIMKESVEGRSFSSSLPGEG